MTLLKKEEKRVEYIELVYDLIFVYIVGRNNAILHHTENGFFSLETFFTYALCTLAIIQIWNFSNFYMNVYGRRSVREHIFLFVNMYLLYHMAVGIGTYQQSSAYRFCIAWTLILINIGVQHIIEIRNHKDSAIEVVNLKRKAFILFAEAALVGVHMIVYSVSGISLAYIPILFGIIASIVSGKMNSRTSVDFGHLTERAMLYVVFTFGEMIITIASYFSDEVTPNSLYFSFMAFIIVVGLFLSYGTFYNHIIDRGRETNGTVYMLIHVFMIFALNNISVALEFMRDVKIALIPKTLFLAISFVLFFVFLFFTGIYAKKRCAFNKKFLLIIGCLGVSFIALMLLFSNMMYINIAVTVIYIFLIYFLLYRKSKLIRE